MPAETPQQLPLTGVRVLDLSRYQAGPKAAMMLADLGAEVIRAESPGGERDGGFAGPMQDGFSIYYAVYNRNKKSVGLNMRTPEGRQILRELVPHLDVIIENFRPGLLDSLGFSFEELQQLNPKVVLVSISGYGMDGPDANRTAFCNVALAGSGYLAVSGEPFSQVHHTGVSIADRLAGVHAAVGALAALTGRAVSGQGAHVDVSLLDAALSMIEFPLATFLSTGQRPPVNGPTRRAGSSPNHVFHAKDGLVLINAPKQDQWERLLRAMDRADLITDPRFSTPILRQSEEARAAIEQLIDVWIAELTVEQAQDVLIDADVPSAPVREIDAVAADPQLRHRNMIVQVENPISGAPLYVTGNPVKLAGVEERITSPVIQGTHNAEIYGTLLGYGEEKLQDLHSRGVI
jgi:crotonobetainyl-CoA:carnitine CoA-transferase CaiB-like acyl-CoA transferase